MKIQGFEDVSAGLKDAYLVLFFLACMTLKMKTLRYFERWWLFKNLHVETSRKSWNWTKY